MAIPKLEPLHAPCEPQTLPARKPRQHSPDFSYSKAHNNITNCPSSQVEPSDLTVEPLETALWRGISSQMAKERNNAESLKVGAASPETKLQDMPYLLLQSQHLEPLKIGQRAPLLSSIPSLRPSALIPFLVHLLLFPSLCHRGSPSCTG